MRLPPILDPLAACVVIFFIGKLAYEILKETAVTLSDHALVDAEKIKKIVESVPGADFCHDVRAEDIKITSFLISTFFRANNDP